MTTHQPDEPERSPWQAPDVDPAGIRPATPSMPTEVRILALVLASVALLLFAFVEMVFIEYPVAWWLYLAVAALFAVGLLRSRPPRRQIGPILTFSALVLVIATLHLVPWSSRNGFLKHLFSIRRGATVADARAIMKGYIGGIGLNASDEATFQGTLGFRHANDAAYGADIGFVEFTDGRVDRVWFSPD